MLYNENMRTAQLVQYKISMDIYRDSWAEIKVVFMQLNNCEQLIPFIHTLFLERALVPNFNDISILILKINNYEASWTICH